jgi:dienelactone hydrolase
MHYISGIRFAAGLLAMAVGLAAQAAPEARTSLKTEDAGLIWFASAGGLAPSANPLLLVPGDSAVISGDLKFPAGPGPFPAVVLAHGCNGIDQSMHDWAGILRSSGYATLVLDSFTGRDLTEVCTNPYRLSGPQRIPDSYGALRILATHPKVDPQRVVLMGFSHGAIMGLGAATEWAKKNFAAGKPSFRAFVMFYPYCNISFPEDEKISAPLRMHLGGQDDWTPAANCVQYAARLKASGQDASAITYADAYHGFDIAGLPVFRLPDAPNAANCVLRQDSILGPAPGPGAWVACAGKGATVGGNATARTQAIENVRGQLAELLKAGS